MNFLKYEPVTILIFVVSSLLFTSVNAESSNTNGLFIKSSHYSVTETLNRFESIIKKKGITVFARINHSLGAKNVGIDLEPTEIIIFGNPKLGTPLMNSRRSAAIDLPLKAIAWQDKDGKVWLAYNTADYIAKRHNINDKAKIIKKMNGALNKFSDYATQKSQ